MSQDWKEAQEWEAGWWGNCANTFGEEAKQISYAHRMGLVNIGVGGGYWPVYDLAGKDVVDLGGGPVSILLKCVNLRRALVVDPADYPAWIGERYDAAGIRYVRRKAEDSRLGRGYDECWIYNVLQHVEDPEAVVANARRIADTIRIFEWIDLAAYQGHLHTLREAELNRWLGAPGRTEVLNENGIVEGLAYYSTVTR